MARFLKRIFQLNHSSHANDNDNQFNSDFTDAEYDYMLTSAILRGDVVLDDNDQNGTMSFDCLLSPSIIILRENIVSAISFSPDNTKFAVGGYDNRATIFDTATAKEITTFQCDSWITTLTFSPDSTKLAVAGGGGKATIYNVLSKNVVRVFQRTSHVSSLAFSYDGAKLAVGGADNMAVVYSVESGRLLHTFRRSAPVNTLAFSYTGNKLVVGGNDNQAILYNLTKQVHIFHRGDSIRAVDIIVDDSKLAVAGNDRKVIIYDFLTGEELHILDHDDEVWSIAFSPDGSKIIAGCDGKIVIHDVISGMELQSLQCEGPVWAVSFSSDGKKIAFGGHDNKVLIFDIVAPDERIYDVVSAEATILHEVSPLDISNVRSNNFKSQKLEHVKATPTYAKLEPIDGKTDTIKDISICFIRSDGNPNIDGARATVFIKADLQNTTKLSDALKLVPESSGLFHMDSQTLENEYMLRVIVKDSFILQAEQCDISIEELRHRFDLDFELSLGVRFDQKVSFHSADRKSVV